MVVSGGNNNTDTVEFWDRNTNKVNISSYSNYEMINSLTANNFSGSTCLLSPEAGDLTP